MSMQISVIIPVFNAEKYIEQAVESALLQPETGEVIVVEDASSDKSLQVCKALLTKSDRVRLLRHEDHGNHGAAISRNLGIRYASFDFIAFLDADDFFLQDRFSVALDIFQKDPEVEGVYEAIGTYFENKEAEDRWFSRVPWTLTTMTERVPPEQLFESQWPIGSSGFCATGGWVVKRSLFGKTGLFDDLRLHQDTVMFVKFAAMGKMVAGRLDQPVAMRRVHDFNRHLATRTAKANYTNVVLVWATLWRWGIGNLPPNRRSLIAERFIQFAATPYCGGSPTSLKGRIASASQLLLLLSQYPRLSGESFYWKRLLANFMNKGTIRALKHLLRI